jgi:protein phosphatase
MAMNQPYLALGVGVRTEQGRRENNQDKMTAFSTPMGMFYIVADGMGGHRGGAEASHRVVEGFQNHLNSFQESADLTEILQRATSLTNLEILAESNSGDPLVAGMGSTVAMAVLMSKATGMEMMTAHIGDSRAYMLRNGKLRRLTRDHSAVQRMVDEQLITPEVARTHPDLNILTRAIGKQPDVAIEVGELIDLHPGDTVLLCTDGLWGPLLDEQIAQELSIDRSAQDSADALVQLALDAGSDDNITLQVLRLESRNNNSRPYPPPGPSLGLHSPVFQTGATQPSAAFSTPAESEPLVPPPAVGRVPKKKPILLIAAVALICLSLAAGGGYYLRRYLLTAHSSKTTPAAPQGNCPAWQWIKPGANVCSPKPNPIPASTGTNADRPNRRSGKPGDMGGKGTQSGGNRHDHKSVIELPRIGGEDIAVPLSPPKYLPLAPVGQP